jgi:hypothetical protein
MLCSQAWMSSSGKEDHAELLLGFLKQPPPLDGRQSLWPEIVYCLHLNMEGAKICESITMI